MEKNTCLITLVNPGLPDSVIRVFPADHKEEKIWMDKRPGQERWEAVKTLMKRFCPKGQYIPEPVYYHPPTGKQEDLQTRLINSVEDIPLIELDGAQLSAPPAKERIHIPEKTETQANKEQVAVLTDQVTKLTSAVASLLEAQSHRQVGRPRKEE